MIPLSSRLWRLVTLLVMAAPHLLSSASAQNTYSEIPIDAGGWVSGFAQHSSGRLYGYGDIFGIYRSDNFGANWTFLQNRMTDASTAVSGVAVSPTSADRVAFTAGGDVWTSINAGVDWTKRLSDRKSPDRLDRGSKALAYHPTAQDELWLASVREGQSSTLWRSTNNGALWASVGGTPFVNERAKTIHLFPTAPNEIWVGTEAIAGRSTTGGLWCSADSGANWHKVWNNNGSATVYYGAPNVSSIARNASRVSLFASNNGVWQVTATNWSNPLTYSATQRTFDLQSIPNVTALADGSFWTAEMGDQAWAPKVSPDGINWTDRPATMTAAYVPEWSTAEHLTRPDSRVYGRDMLVQDVNNPARWLLTGGFAAHLSEDSGRTWRLQPGGMAGVPTFRVDFDRSNPGRAYLSSSDHGLFVVDDGGFSGKTSKSSDRTFNELQTIHETMATADGNTLIGAGVSQGLNRTVIIRSNDGGTRWNRVTSTGLPENVQGVTKAVMSLNDSNDFLVLLGFDDQSQPNNPGLYRTRDGGQSFNAVGVGNISFDGVNTGQRYHPGNAYLERDGVNSNVRYLALRAYPGNSAPRGVWRSTDGGTTWEKRTADAIGNGWEAIAGFAVDPTIEGRLWAVASSLRRSDDGGGTWLTVGDFTNGNTTYVSAYDRRIAVIGRRPGDTFNKIYYSDNDGANWREMTDADHRMAWASSVTVDPWRPGQIWVGGSRSYQIINPPVTVSTPMFNPAGGSYTTAQSVTLSTSTSGATIRYTTNGADPTSSSTVASGPISITATTTLKARAFRLGHPESAVASATYTINSGGPSGYTFAANENSSYTFTEPVDVAYGANGNFNYLYGVTGTITFNNATFGDPVPGVGKQGYYKLASGRGSITREVWTGVSGTAVSAIPVTTPPNTSDTLTSFETATNAADIYGTRVRGYLTAPTTGDYYFWISGDDNCELWLSTDSTVANKGTAPIARVTSWTPSRVWNNEVNQKSVVKQLEAGQKYYIEALHKEGYGGDNLAVGWAKPGQATTAPSEVIPGSMLSPYGSAASYISTDTTTSGSWKGVYGAGGYNVALDAQSLPAYVSSLAFASKSDWTWSSTPTETKATQRGGTGRIAACWYSGSNFDITVNITGSTAKQVAIYCLNWEGSQRTQTIQPFNASTGDALATAQTVSAFQSGKHVVYSVKGNVRFRVTNTGSPNAVVSAVLFGN